jgi:hypothetical protein
MERSAARSKWKRTRSSFEALSIALKQRDIPQQRKTGPF